jgi:hypothetical protein
VFCRQLSYKFCSEWQWQPPSSSYQLAPQPYVGLGFLHRLWTVNFLGFGLLAPCQTLNLRD